MILVIAEKPSVGAAIGKVLGATSRKDGYLEGNNYIVSWCVGHLVGLADASSYDERFAKWRYSDLPIVPEEWLFEIPKDIKFVRGKKQKDEDLDFFDDEGYEEEPYINEDEEPVIADDEDDEAETKETEESI